MKSPFAWRDIRAGLVASTALLVVSSGAVSGGVVAADATGSVVVRTTSGAVARSRGAIEVFKGIPYAAPPVGPLRWRAPEPPAPWSGVRDASHFGSDCMQTPYVISTGQSVSEDCLTVNVWTPGHGPSDRRPVMVFIYGGGFIGGSAAYPLYDGSRLASHGVVVVSFNYRVGILGFLAHPMLSAESPHRVSGNYGLLDQIAALNWVHANVAAFGGDPRRITVFGESAGAESIAYLMTSPLAAGLFQRAVIESPALPPLPRLAVAEQSGAALAADIATLRAIPAETLLAHNGDFFPHLGLSQAGDQFPTPTLDGYVVPMAPADAFRHGIARPVPTVVGINAQEGRMFVGDGSPVTLAVLQTTIERSAGPLAAEFRRLYPAGSDAEAANALADLVGDELFVDAARRIARGVSLHQPRTFAYLFTRSMQGRPTVPTHSEELPYVFGTLEAPSFIPHPPPDADDRKLSETIMRAWVRFAATGDPNGPGLARWPSYERATDPYLELGDRMRVGGAYRAAQLDAIERRDGARGAH